MHIDRDYTNRPLVCQVFVTESYSKSIQYVPHRVPPAQSVWLPQDLYTDGLAGKLDACLSQALLNERQQARSHLRTFAKAGLGQQRQLGLQPKAS